MRISSPTPRAVARARVKMIRGKINPNTKRPSNCATISERKVEQERGASGRAGLLPVIVGGDIRSPACAWTFAAREGCLKNRVVKVQTTLVASPRNQIRRATSGPPSPWHDSLSRRAAGLAVPPPTFRLAGLGRAQANASHPRLHPSSGIRRPDWSAQSRSCACRSSSSLSSCTPRPG